MPHTCIWTEQPDQALKAENSIYFNMGFAA